MITEYKEKISLKMLIIISLLTIVSKISRKKLWSFVVHKRQNFIQPKRQHKASVYEINGIKVIRFSQTNEAEKYVVYFHGGGFVMSGNRRHHNFIINLSKKTDFTCYYIDYPLAPKNKAVEVIEKIESVIKEIQKQEIDKEMILLGDSAGGNLALVLSKKFPKVKSIILLSPWLDLTMTNPKIIEMERQEIMFSKHDLLGAAMDYQGNLELNNVMVSPIYDDFTDKEINIFAGKDDLLFPDVLKFTEINNCVNLHKYHGLKHDFMFILEGKEQKHVLNEITKYLK